MVINPTTSRFPTRARCAWALVVLLAALIAVADAGSADSAPLRVVVLGETASSVKPACPAKVVNNVPLTPCRVEGHVTGFQAIADGEPRPYQAPFDGKIVSWSITLSKPSHRLTKTTTDEVGFFDDLLGRPSEARIGVLRKVGDRKPPQFRLVRQSPLEVLNSYFGTTVEFALAHPLTILRGQVVALTIPTWAPMFAFRVGGNNTWRGSRKPNHCIAKSDIQAGHPQQRVKSKKTYGCYYTSARLLYTATLVKKP